MAVLNLSVFSDLGSSENTDYRSLPLEMLSFCTPEFCILRSTLTNSDEDDLSVPLRNTGVRCTNIEDSQGVMSLFHCYVNEVDHLDKAKAAIPTMALDRDVRLQEAIRCSIWPEDDPNRLMKCDIPNFINTDQNSSFGEDDLLILEPPIVLENKPVAQTSHKDLN
ncbi:Melanocortin-2 receptor accessory protein 2 [Camelus dromedarius]|uniref:Melanocortin-2 receptor accessory protein 2 n=1 Tax=Camelus dromedarius TaxID=9838 RepID=A0A5N4BXD1_CAMDR|nr:Melanocortin-2 receptor accessory protein 2 [Camelus dromedarius]